MPTLTMTKGLPGSGKSTWAEEVCLAAHTRTVRITKDQLRVMLHAGKHGGRSERQTLAARDALAATFLDQGVNVIIDDTNLARFHEVRLRELAGEHGATFEVRDFTDVPLEVCLTRNAGRPNPVPERVIRKMWLDHIAIPDTPVFDPSLPMAILVDIDGTLAVMTDRGPFDWHRVGEDLPNRSVIVAATALWSAGYIIVCMSGRDAVCRPQTEAWLTEHVGVDGPLFMRAEGDNRKDSIVKRELFDAHIRGRYNVLFVLDDRNQVVDMWRHELGLPCFQVAEGDF